MSSLDEVKKALLTIKQFCEGKKTCYTCELLKGCTILFCGNPEAWDVDSIIPEGDKLMRSIDAKIVEHGKWLDVEPAPWGQVYETCSKCGVRQTLDKGRDKYCPVCGVKMREAEE